MPIKFEGILSRGPNRRGGIDAVSLRWWPCLIPGMNESGVFFEFSSKSEGSAESMEQRRQAAQDEYLRHRGSFQYTESDSSYSRTKASRQIGARLVILGPWEREMALVSIPRSVVDISTFTGVSTHPCGMLECTADYTASVNL